MIKIEQLHKITILSFLLSCFLLVSNAAPLGTSYVHFISYSQQPPVPTVHVHSWISYPENFPTLAFEPHLTPDYSNELAHPDPLLLTGYDAKRAALLAYRKPLFFDEIRHTESLLRNQELRKQNGLAGNVLGSLRTNSPFYRFKQDHFGSLLTLNIIEARDFNAGLPTL